MELKCSYKNIDKNVKRWVCQLTSWRGNPFTMYRYIKSPQCMLEISYSFIRQLYLSKAETYRDCLQNRLRKRYNFGGETVYLVLTWMWWMLS